MLKPQIKRQLVIFSILTTAALLSLITLLAGTALLGTSGWFITATALTTAGAAALGTAALLLLIVLLVAGFSAVPLAAYWKIA